MKKTLLLVTHFPPVIGGTPSLYYHLCKYMEPDKIVVVTEKAPGCEDFDKELPFKIYRVEKFSHIDSHIFQEVSSLRHILKREQIEVLLFGHINFCLTALILKFLFGKPYYLYVLGEEITRNYGGRYYQFFKWRALRQAKGLVSISDFTTSLVKEYNANVKTIYPGVDTSQFTPKAKKQELLEKYTLEGKQVLLTIARLENRKGHDKVIETLPRIVQTCPEVRYLIGGEGEEEERLRALVRQLNLQDVVEFVGKIPDERLADYYNLCDIFVMPVRDLHDGNTEGFGIVFLEANACGKAVIGGNVGGVPSAVRDGYSGFLIDGTHETDLYTAVVKLLQDTALRELVEKNALQWVKKFTYQTAVTSLEQFLD